MGLKRSEELREPLTNLIRVQNYDFFTFLQRKKRKILYFALFFCRFVWQRGLFGLFADDILDLPGGGVVVFRYITEGYVNTWLSCPLAHVKTYRHVVP